MQCAIDANAKLVGDFACKAKRQLGALIDVKLSGKCEHNFARQNGIAPTVVHLDAIPEVLSVAHEAAAWQMNARIEHDITHVFEEDMRAKGRTVTFRVLENIQMPAPSRLVGVFDAADRAGLRRIRRVRSLSGRPISLEDRYIPARYAEMLDEKLLTGSSIFLLLRRWAQAGTIRCVNAVRSELAGEEIIELLGVPPGTPVLVRETSYYGAHSTPLMYSSVSFLGPSYQFCFETEMKIA